VSRDWDETEHPRHPEGAPDSRGGQFRRFAAPASYETLGNVMGEQWQVAVSRRLARDGYVPGAWEPMDLDEYRRELHAELSLDVPAEVVDDLFAEYEWPAAVYRNGDHRVAIQDRFLAMGRADQILAHLDELQTRVPIQKPIRMAVVDAHFIGGARGSALPLTGILFVAEMAFDEWGEDRYGGGRVMPVASTGAIEQWRYGMTHEWGHLVDPQQVPRTWRDDAARKAQDLMYEHEAEMTPYGMGHRNEALAEAFAEWFLTQGRSTNGAAQAYAAAFGWRWER